MAYPLAVVEVAFNDGPYVVSPTWTDITSYVYDMEIVRGRDDDWSEFYGSATITLNNRARTFDPFYTSGTYYGKLTPRRQIRIRATHGGTTYDVFRGFISGWPPAWTDAGTNSTVTISCFDALQLLGSAPLPVEWARDYILSTSPRHYYTCEEPVTPFVATGYMSDLGSYPMVLTFRSPASNGERLAQGLPATSVQGTAGVAASSDWYAYPVNTNTDFSVAAWFTSDTATNPALHGTTGQYDWYFGIDTTVGKYLVIIRDGVTGTERRWTTNSLFETAVPRHLAFTFNMTTKALVFYADGITVATTNTNTAAVVVTGGELFEMGYGQVQQAVLWTSVIAQATIQEIYNRSVALFAETTSARVTRIIGATSFSASLVSTPASPASSVIGIGTDAPAAAIELQKVAASEYAPLFVSKSGTLTLFQQNQIRTQTASIVSQVTYGSGGVGLGQDVELQYDGDSMRNTANVAVSQGGVYKQTNTASVTAYGQSDAFIETEISNLTDAQDVAQIVSGWGGQVYPLAQEVEVVVSPTGTWGTTLALELMDRVTLAIAPPSGNVITVPMLAQKIRHRVVPGRWQTFLEGSARWAAVFILNQSVLDGTDLLG